MEALTGLELVTLCTQLPIIPWLMEAAPHKFCIATKAFLLKWN